MTDPNVAPQPDAAYHVEGCWGYAQHFAAALRVQVESPEAAILTSGTPRVTRAHEAATLECNIRGDMIAAKAAKLERAGRPTFIPGVMCPILYLLNKDNAAAVGVKA